MNRLLSKFRDALGTLRDEVSRRLKGTPVHERVIESEPRSTAGSPAARSTSPASIDSAHYSDVKQMPEGQAVSREERHEVSSLRGDHAIAPSAEAAGQMLVDTGAVEVPLGQTADRSFHDELDHSKLPQPETTGSSLHHPVEQTFAMFEDENAENIMATAQPYGEPTAMPTPEHNRELFPFEDEHYDSLDPEDLGATFLSRATEDRILGRREEWDEDISEDEVDRAAMSGDVVPHMVSEASRASASLGEDELSELEEIHLDASLRQTIPMDVRNRPRGKDVQRPSQV
jgi:hypothetical protein